MRRGALVAGSYRYYGFPLLGDRVYVFLKQRAAVVRTVVGAVADVDAYRIFSACCFI